MSQIPDFTDAELKAVNDTLEDHYKHPVETQGADIEFRLYPDDRELTECPAVYWEKDGCPGEPQFFSQFFYSNTIKDLNQ